MIEDCGKDVPYAEKNSEMLLSMQEKVATADSSKKGTGMGFVRSSTEDNHSQNAGKKIRAIVADKYPLVRSGIRSELPRTSGAEIVGEAEDGKAAVDLAKTLEPDIVLMSIALPVLNGLEATARITRDLPRSRVLILSRHDDEEYVLAALKKGAATTFTPVKSSSTCSLAFKHLSIAL